MTAVIAHRHRSRAEVDRLSRQEDAMLRAHDEVEVLERRLESARAARRDTLVLNVRENGWPLELAAAASGVSTATARDWVSA